MQTRDDVDLRFANIFRRMMAKSPDERYASFDEVIDELSDYCDQTDTPAWLADFTNAQTQTEMTTVSGGSTSGATARVLAIDFGMFYSAAAAAAPSGDVNLLTAGSEDRVLFRMAVASEQGKLLFGNQAMERRAERPRKLVHCLPMYIGMEVVERLIAGRQCPPEVLLGLMLRRVAENAWDSNTRPHAAAITIPTSYDQLHRRSVLQAASLAGLQSVRLVDRSIAAVQTLLLDSPQDSPETAGFHSEGDQTVLFVGLTGQATEVAVMRKTATRVQQLSSAGHWLAGTLPWQHRLVDLTADLFVTEHSVDPRKEIRTASRLQVACERAMNSLLLMPNVNITINIDGFQRSVSLKRQTWLESCRDLIDGVRGSIVRACKQASISWSDIGVCVTLGPLLRISEVRELLLGELDEAVEFHAVDRADVARGAAASLAGELPGRGMIASPPRCVTSQSIGIVVEDVRGRRRILPIIPKGTALPARTNRRLTVGKNRETMTLSLVESSGLDGEDWQSLGRYDFDIGGANRLARTRMIGFEVDMNGLLSVRAQTPGTQGSQKLPALPPPALNDEAVAEWTAWMEEVR